MEDNDNPDPGAAPSLVDPISSHPLPAEERDRLMEQEREEARQQTYDAAIAAITACNEAAVAAQAAAHRLRDREWLSVSGERAALLYAAAADAVRALPIGCTQQDIVVAQLDALTKETARLAELDKIEIEELSKIAHESELDYLGKRELANDARRKAENFGKLGALEKSVVGGMLGMASMWAMAKWMGGKNP